MAASISTVRLTSITGEFDSLSDEVISAVLIEVGSQYATLKKELGIAQATVNALVSLHAAHVLALGKKLEAGGEDLPGMIKSESLARVGSRSYGSASKLDDGAPLQGWGDTSYGRRWHSIWSRLPPACKFVAPAL